MLKNIQYLYSKNRMTAIMQVSLYRCKIVKSEKKIDLNYRYLSSAGGDKSTKF